jgi:predicted nucleic acid-binding protein
MSSIRNEAWSTCPITEMGFLRIVTSPSFSPLAPRWKEAAETLHTETHKNPMHLFWPDSLPLLKIDQQFGSRIQGHNQITDAYLLALAMHHQGRMVTFDYRMASLAPKGSQEENALVILKP